MHISYICISCWKRTLSAYRNCDRHKRDENQSTYFILGSKLIFFFFFFWKLCWHCLWAKEKIWKYNFHVNYYIIIVDDRRWAPCSMFNVNIQRAAIFQRYNNEKQRPFALASIRIRLLSVNVHCSLAISFFAFFFFGFLFDIIVDIRIVQCRQSHNVQITNSG